ncbi:MAG TPA: hypothetical protein VGG41_11895 [Solirubrobacteraceae bacterium]
MHSAIYSLRHASLVDNDLGARLDKPQHAVGPYDAVPALKRASNNDRGVDRRHHPSSVVGMDQRDQLADT